MRTAHPLLAAVVVCGLALVATGQEASAGSADRARLNLTAATIDLGTLGGDSEATAIDGTVVVGESSLPSGPPRAFAYDLAAAEPAMIDLGTLGGSSSSAAAVDGTVVVGESSTASGRVHAFVYDLAAAEPAMVDLGTLGGSFSVAQDIDGTVVVGRSATVSGAVHAFVYDLAAAEPVMVDLGTLGGSFSAPRDVDGSVVVGVAGTSAAGGSHAFAYDLAADEPSMRDLGTLGSGRSVATAVDGTLVTGESYTASGRLRAFAFDLAADEPAMQDLGTLGGRSGATAIDGTTIVGSSFVSGRRLRAFVYDIAAAEPSMKDLGTVRGGESTFLEATAIDADVVIGEWRAPRRGSASFSFAHDLDSDRPALIGLGTWRGSKAADVDGDVVVGWSDTGSSRRATAWVLRETTQPMFAFRRFDRQVKEGAGRATIRVTRYGRTDRAVTVRYRARSDTARAGKDFGAASGELRFPKGVTRRSFQVKIRDDRRSEGKEHLLLTLSDPSSAALLGTPSWSQLRIKDDDR